MPPKPPRKKRTKKKPAAKAEGRSMSVEPVWDYMNRGLLKRPKTGSSY